ncbi:MAG: glycosyl transferase family 2 [Phenylobacterium sp.]|nr:glycosyl transferase family 2 [Phenylobacterium sp.]
MSEEIASAQEAYGFARLGPIVAYFLHDLEGVLERLVGQRGGRALFVSRGGLLIQEALDTYRASTQSKPRAGDTPFYVSRFLAAKGAWLRAPERALALMDREFGAGTAATYLRRLDPSAPTPSNDERVHGSFSEFMKEDGPEQVLCREHLETQANLFERYALGIFGRSRLCTLIDTGWQGTIQALLTHTFPDHEFWGVNFGRYGEEIDPAIRARLFGLGFNGPYDERRPLSAITHHRHLIEALFEPTGESVEHLEDIDGEVEPVGVERFSPLQLRASEPALFDGVLRYLREVAGSQSYAALVREKELAAKLLADDILFPSRETARLIGGFSRSIDFGRRDGVRVLVDQAETVRGPEERIRASLWKQGQIALECRPAIARERQRALLPKRRPDRAASHEKRAWDPAAPKVAIIMRTMDRLIFLQRAFESVTRQTFDDYVLVIFNDGGDVEGVEGELTDSRLDRRKVILLDGVENRGMEAASNAAIRHAQSEYVVIHDDDDTWIMGFLEKTVGYLDRNTSAGGVVTRSYRVEEEISGDRVVLRGRSFYNDWMNNIQLGELLSGNFFPPISFLFRRSHWDLVGGFKETLPVLGDWDFNIKIAARAEIGVIAENLANYHYRDARDGGSYSNSLVGGADLHQRYNAVVRQSLVFDEELRSLAGAMTVAPMVSEVRRLLRRASSTGGRIDGPEAADLALAADQRWCMLAYAQARPDKIGTLTLLAALKHAEAHGVPTPPDFDEAAYLGQHADVRRIVETGGCRSGFLHFILHGRSEGRRRPSKVTANAAG